MKLLSVAVALLFALSPLARAALAPVAEVNWFQLQTPSFTIFSPRPDLSRAFAVRLEQFREAYAKLAGPKAVASLPILIFAFPDGRAFRPFLPVHQGKIVPAGGYFQRDFDENVIALNLELVESGSMEVIFHEYMHLLMRHNDRIWPLWLKEGMAEVYSTFQIENNRVCLGVARPRHLELLRNQPLMPMEAFFKVDNDSPQYNERELRGIFYSQSWLLTHYLVLGGSAVRKSQYGVFNRKLREGIEPAAAFKQAFETDFDGMQKELQGYITRGRFEPLCYNLSTAADFEKSFIQRPLPRVETLYQLGNLLLHTQRLDEAEAYFTQARAVAPESARPLEGLGLLAARRDRSDEAIQLLGQAIDRKSVNFRAHFEYGRQIYDSMEKSSRGGRAADEEKVLGSLRAAAQRAPMFAPAHYLLGVVEMNRDKDAVAAKHLRAAMDLEPENHAFLLAFGHLQVKRREFGLARQTLKPLLQPKTNPEIRQQAETLMKAMDDMGGARGR